MGMDERNGFRRVDCKGRLLRRLRRRNRQNVFVAVMEQMEFPFVPSVPFQPASGSWTVASAVGRLQSGTVRKFLKKLKILN